MERKELNFISRWGRKFTAASMSRAYKLTFNLSGACQTVLADLGGFCHATESTFCNDPYEHARLAGRRDVWLRIRNHLDLPEDQLQILLAGRHIQPQQE